MKLNDLFPNPGSTKKRKRKGIGPSAGQGKTGGRGTKGQSSRTGSGGHLYRQGGSLPFFRRLPFIRGEGFTPPNRVDYNIVNLDQLTRFESGTVITPDLLAKANILSHAANPVVILGRGEVTVPLKISVQRVSKTARAKIEAAGGTVETI